MVQSLSDNAAPNSTFYIALASIFANTWTTSSPSNNSRLDSNTLHDGPCWKEKIFRYEMDTETLLKGDDSICQRSIVVALALQLVDRGGRLVKHSFRVINHEGLGSRRTESKSIWNMRICEDFRISTIYSFSFMFTSAKPLLSGILVTLSHHSAVRLSEHTHSACMPRTSLRHESFYR